MKIILANPVAREYIQRPLQNKFREMRDEAMTEQDIYGAPLLTWRKA